MVRAGAGTHRRRGEREGGRQDLRLRGLLLLPEGSAGILLLPRLHAAHGRREDRRAQSQPAFLRRRGLPQGRREDPRRPRPRLAGGQPALTLESTALGIYVIASLALILTPGQDMLYVITRSLAQGRVAGVLSAVGVCCGILVHTALAALG